MAILRSPSLQRAAGIISILSAAIITGIPLVITDVPRLVYWIALALLVGCEVLQFVIVERSRLETEAVRSQLKEEKSRIARQLVRTSVIDVCAEAPAALSADTQITWAARISSESGIALLEVNFDSIELAGITPLKFGTKRVDQCEVAGGLRLMGASHMHGGSGRRFEFFYRLPVEVKIADCRPLGFDVIDRLVEDDILMALLTG